MTRNLPGHAGDALLRSGTSEPESAAEQGDADRSAEQDTHDAPGPRGGDSHDPRSLEDKTRRSIAYLLIALPSDRKHVTARAERERAVYLSVTDASHLEELRRLFKRVELTPWRYSIRACTVIIPAFRGAYESSIGVAPQANLLVAGVLLGNATIRAVLEGDHKRPDNRWGHGMIRPQEALSSLSS